MTPEAITFTGTINFTPGCAECVAATMRFVAAALDNRSVAQVTLRAGKLHAHAVRVAPPPSPAGAESLFPSDTNGSDPEAVQRWMERETGA